MSELQQTGGFSKFTIFDLDGLVLKVVKEFADPIKQKGLELLYVPPIKKLPMIKGDISKIEEVVRRLLDNAMTFTDEGKISVSLEQNGEFLEVWIKDTGRGIPAKNLPYVFNKFYRIKTALEMEQGTGISLYLCKKIIDNHKGTIGVQSIEGQGSSFYFSVPISK
jgi:signal transduction histidine kinase